jgi:hypothetical protein
MNRAEIEAQLPELREALDTALERLRARAGEFGQDSQQRWMVALRAASAARDELWYAQQRLDKLVEDAAERGQT